MAPKQLCVLELRLANLSASISYAMAKYPYANIAHRSKGHMPSLRTANIRRLETKGHAVQLGMVQAAAV